MGGTGGPMMGQGVGPGRMIPGMSAAMPPRGPPGSRGMVGMQMMGNGEKSPRLMLNRSQTGHFDIFSAFLLLFFLEMGMANPAYPQQHAPPNQTAPWPDQMMAMDHCGNQSRCESLNSRNGI